MTSDDESGLKEMQNTMVFWLEAYIMYACFHIITGFVIISVWFRASYLSF